jgi:ABC-type Fe3+-hydroxamate transport system substrate-binding protein
MKIRCHVLDNEFELDETPRRIVSLNPGFSEAIVEMGAGDRLAGISSYCSRFISPGEAVVAGDYLKADHRVLKELDPDLILITTGVQLRLGRELVRAGYPVYALPLPSSFHGILENIINISALCGVTGLGRELARRLEDSARTISAATPWERDNAPGVYPELWFGLHPRSIGGRSYIHDIIRIAGGHPLGVELADSYTMLDFARVEQSRPGIFLGFHEPEYPMDFPLEAEKRGWNWLEPGQIIVSTTEKGKNIIHDGPSLVQTSSWLQEQMVKSLN